MAEIEVKALIDKKMNKVIFVESNADLVDMLFSFMTRPMGNIIKLTRNQTSTVMIGSMNNLYNSAESLDVKYLQWSASRSMLLCPRNGDEARIRQIRPSLEDDHDYDYFICQFCQSHTAKYGPKKSQEKLSYYKDFSCLEKLSYYKDVSCVCGKFMDRAESVYEPNLEDENGGVFVKGLTRYLITDRLQIVPLSTVAGLSLLSKQEDVGDDAIEERTFGIGVNEILNLLKSLLVSSDFPLTETLLKNSTVERSFQEQTDQGIEVKQEGKMCASRRDEKRNCVKLLVSKTKAVVCYAEADEDFINLLLSFLTVPLGFIAKEMRGSSLKGCLSHLYKSVESLDATKHLMSDEIKQFLLSPKIATHFGFENQLLSVEEIVPKKYYYAEERQIANPCSMIVQTANPSSMIATDASLIKFSSPRELRLLDPRSSYKEEMKSKGGYVQGPAMFIVTDSLVIAPISLFPGFTILKKLNVPYSDIEERIVHVGKEEAARLLVASLISESPLTDVFLRKAPKQEC